MITAKQIILKGAELIETYGHCIGHAGSESEGFCMIGACGAAQAQLATDGDWEVYYDFLLRFISGKSACDLVSTYSDSHSKEDVVATMRACAESLP